MVAALAMEQVLRHAPRHPGPKLHQQAVVYPAPVRLVGRHLRLHEAVLGVGPALIQGWCCSTEANSVEARA